MAPERFGDDLGVWYVTAATAGRSGVAEVCFVDVGRGGRYPAAVFLAAAVAEDQRPRQLGC
jgi:hypothetical protein